MASQNALDLFNSGELDIVRREEFDTALARIDALEEENADLRARVESLEEFKQNVSAFMMRHGSGPSGGTGSRSKK